MSYKNIKIHWRNIVDTLPDISHQDILGVTECCGKGNKAKINYIITRLKDSVQ